MHSCAVQLLREVPRERAEWIALGMKKIYRALGFGLCMISIASTRSCPSQACSLCGAAAAGGA